MSLLAFSSCQALSRDCVPGLAKVHHPESQSGVQDGALQGDLSG